METTKIHAMEWLPNCPVCETPAFYSKPMWSFGPYRLNQCLNPSCRCAYLNPRAPEDELAAQYDSESYYKSDDGIHGYFDYESEELAIRRTTRRRLEDARRKMPQDTVWGPRLLDIGGAYGFGSLEARDLGFEPTLVEASEHSREYARGRGLEAVDPGYIRMLQDSSVDVVISWDCLEHVYDLRELVANIYRVLRPGGVFLFNVPAVDSKSARLFRRHWWAYREPEHLIYLTPESVRYLIGPFFQLDATWPDKQDMTLGGAALRFGRMMPRWLAPTMGGITYMMLETLHLDKVSISIPHGLRMWAAHKLSVY